MLEHYRRFIAFRRNFPALTKGDIEFLAASGDVVAFTRGAGNERIVCAFNLGSKPAELHTARSPAETCRDMDLRASHKAARSS